jgi:acyl carrier protein
MLNHQDIVLEAKKFIATQLEMPEETVDADQELKSLGLDSFRIIEVVLFLERRTGLSFPDYAYTPSNLKTVDSIVASFLKLQK